MRLKKQTIEFYEFTRAQKRNAASRAARAKRRERQMMCHHEWSAPYGFEGDEQQTCRKCGSHRGAR